MKLNVVCIIAAYIKNIIGFHMFNLYLQQKHNLCDRTLKPVSKSM